MLMEKERNLIVKYGKKLIKSGLTTGTGGNLSIFNRDKELIAISPSGVDYFETQAEDVVILDLNGKVIHGMRNPSSEFEMHSIFYKNRDDIDAMVHTHSIYAATIASLRWDLPPVHYLIALAGSNVRCADYATYGTKKLAENAFKSMKNRKAVLLANHGLLVGRDSLEGAFGLAEHIEFCSELYYRSKSIGEPVILSEEEMSIMHKKFKTDNYK